MTSVVVPSEDKIVVKKSVNDSKIPVRNELLSGVIDHWCDITGYGILSYDKKKAFVHISNCVRVPNTWLSFKCNDKVTFFVDNNVATSVQKFVGTPPRKPQSPNADSPGS